MTLTCSTAETVAGIYEAFGRGDIPAILATLADDVAWEVWPDHSHYPHLADPERFLARVAEFTEHSRT